MEGGQGKRRLNIPKENWKEGGKPSDNRIHLCTSSSKSYPRAYLILPNEMYQLWAPSTASAFV